MKLVKNNFYIALEIFSNFLLLNLIWFMMCLPIVTIFPATAALFGVVRQWVLKEDSSVFRSFFKYFKDNFKQSFLLGLLWTIFAGLLYMNFTIISQLGSIEKMFLIPFLFLGGVLLILLSVFLFPVMVHYQLNWIHILKNSLILAMSYLPFTLMGIVALLLMGAAFIWQPITFLFIFSIGAYFIFFISNMIFKKAEQIRFSIKRAGSN
ncbi:YesL family protein [Bacillus sp. USDA818B3_A]|uniref:YesL family protein n=1 Tax=Bacillus sp. USDA818B3_A TaxID=2698834 RepID=UPI001370A1B0|nr:DUF624 domain-containing protein [Bacillus sp. USDA818B3_A]